MHNNTPNDSGRQGLLMSILTAMPAVDAEAVPRAAAELHHMLRQGSALDASTVLVAYGGGKDSSFMVAFVRAIQLQLSVIHGCSFRLRVATNRHAGMPQAVTDNIERVYNALDMNGDRSVELLLIDGDEVSLFDAAKPMPASLVRRNRSDVLMNGHRFAGEARPTFCNACNLSMVNSFGVAAAWNGGADVIVTGDSLREQRAYLAWSRRLARDFGAAIGQNVPGLGGFLRTMDGIGRAYGREIHGEAVADQGVAHVLPGDPRFFSVYGHTAYDAGSHWDFLTGFLEFRFDEVAFSFTETDCANPMLMCHFRGMRSERLHGRSYAEGIAEYRDYALGLMRRKEFPPVLIQRIAERYYDAAAAAHMRQVAASFAAEVFNLSEAQIVCMLFAPFGDQGRRLRRWLLQEAPALLPAEAAIRALLGGAVSTDSALEQALQQLSGLDLAQLRQCWRTATVPNLADPGATATALGRILRDDPHKASITTRHAPGGPEIAEMISGR